MSAPIILDLTPDTLAKQVNDAYLKLKNATTKAFEATTKRQDADALLSEVKQGIILQYAENPKDLGGNDAARAARVNELAQKEIADCAAAARAESVARHELTVAQMNVECIRAMLRLAELSAGIERAGR
jgi:hypothetical protein